MTDSVKVDGRDVRFTHPDKVMYPSTGLTKQGVLDYYLAVASALIPLAKDRPVTRKRWMDGVGTAEKPGKVFFHKDIDNDAPDWIHTHTIEHDDHTNAYPLIDSPAVLAFYVQHNALEFHVPQWRFGPRGARRNPDRIVFDLDPGEGATAEQLVELAVLLRDRLRDDHIETVPVPSGSKGIHLYGALDGKRDSDTITEYGHALASALEEERPDLVVTNIRKAVRAGRILIDWSQNRAAKTTVTPYSLRGRLRPTVACPQTWEELQSGLSQKTSEQAIYLLKQRPCPLLALMGGE
ncbi:MAG: non-homologous end-joining DNA ligase [Demequina sp.]|jgi:bifunctional non-homologous end joining protein LigD|nr:non-homologous end-joining DNA ligase [Demequina sp.]